MRPTVLKGLSRNNALNDRFLSFTSFINKKKKDFGVFFLLHIVSYIETTNTYFISIESYFVVSEQGVIRNKRISKIPFLRKLAKAWLNDLKISWKWLLLLRCTYFSQYFQNWQKIKLSINIKRLHLEEADRLNSHICLLWF